MTRINLFEVQELKKQIKEQFGIDIVLHDETNPQTFELESTNDLIIDFINTYFLEKKLGTIYNDTKTEFRLVKIEQC